MHCEYDKELCEEKHRAISSMFQVHQWIMGTAVIILIAITAGTYHKIDSVQTDTTQMKVSIQRLEDKLEIKDIKPNKIKEVKWTQPQITKN